ncbi:MAG: PP2C family protein-serine/threonine phosphatase [Spirochaetales bacterium]|nr:PP2C family protein-serine/threonine phosphatase [Spirochaetales bacterium]
MFYLISTDKSRLDGISRALKECEMEFQSFEWNTFNKIEKGIYIIENFPDDPKYGIKIDKLIESGNHIISIAHNSSYTQFSDKSILKLAPCSGLKEIKAVLVWLDAQSNSTQQLQDLNHQLNSRTRQIVTELSLASELQKNLLPKHFPDDLPINFEKKYLPHAYIGGDFFDIIRLSNSEIGILIADVSGHGVAAAFITAMLKSVFNYFAPGVHSPAKTLSLLNQEFVNRIHDNYITAFYAIVDTKQMTCKWCNAGHPRQLLFRKNGKIIEISELRNRSFFIGMFDQTVYEDEEIQLKPGDRFLFYTDGIIELNNSDGKPFGLNRVKNIFIKNSDLGISNISNDLMQELMMYMPGSVFEDDITLLIMEIMEDL